MINNIKNQITNTTSAISDYKNKIVKVLSNTTKSIIKIAQEIFKKITSYFRQNNDYHFQATKNPTPTPPTPRERAERKGKFSPPPVQHGTPARKRGKPLEWTTPGINIQR